MLEPPAPASPAPPAFPLGAALRTKLLERDPTRYWRSLLVLLVTMGVFALFEGISFKADGAAILIAVLLFHELGHFLGMKLFGYRDLRIFFIPLLGAATSGRPVGVSAAKRGVVLLLGPLPGLVLALVLVLVLRPANKTLEANLVLMLATLNGLNLLPLEPFDGGKLVHLVVSARWRVLDVASLALGALGMAALAVVFKSIGFGVAAVFMGLQVMPRLNSSRVARALGEKFPTLPDQPEDASDEVLEFVHQEVGTRVLQGRLKNPDSALKATANWARVVFDRARAEHPDALASFALIVVHLSGFVLAAGSVIVLALINRH